MISTKELQAWVATLDPSNSVAIDDGGLMLIEVDSDGDATDAYLEVGGTSDSPELVG